MSNTDVNYGQEQGSAGVSFSGLRFVGLLALPVVCAVILIAVLNFVVFRTLNYYFWVNPESAMGTIVQTEGLVEHQIMPGAKNVIVIGDSRVSEGFSAVIANAKSGRRDINFIQSGMPGTEPRVWFYFLRKVDPAQSKFAAVVLMVARLDDDHQPYDPGARVDDLTFLQPITTYKDALAVVDSYQGIEGKVHAFAAMMLPLATARIDLQDFIAHYQIRSKAARQWNEHFYEWSLAYPGATGDVPAVDANALASFDFASAGLPPLKVAAMNNYVKDVLGKASATPPEQFARYRESWIGKIADEYRKAGVPVLIFQAPRGPYQQFAVRSNDSPGVLGEMARQKRLILLDPKPFEDLERPQYFFDSLHVNVKGRELLTPALAKLIAEQLPEGR